MACPGGYDSLASLRHELVRTVRKRRDMWASREEARRSLPWQGKTPGKTGWHAKTIDTYINYAIVPVQTSGKQTYFTLACTKKQEENMYLDDKGVDLTLDALDKISSKMPLHLVLGEVKDFIPQEEHDALASPSASGRKWASVTTIPGVGHLVHAVYDLLAPIVSFESTDSTGTPGGISEHSISFVARNTSKPAEVMSSPAGQLIYTNR
ncbi:hypothetical protein NMY22_g20150 [Coprinellus aureogranulatus]|nr:hypothetical protein NMY22_g20150 [Coprinellus aureogranulatus]